MVPEATDAGGLELAIVGLACRFPGAGNAEQYWRNLCAGVESVSFFSPDELRGAGVDPVALADPDYVPARGVVDGADLFDAAFFAINPMEADLTDPQQRLFLETCWEAMENSGYAPGAGSQVVGVYGGAYENSYAANLRSHPEVLARAGNLLRHVSSEKDYVTTRVAYKLGLGGPAVTVQTACSTSLVAVHLAGQALLSGECDMALAGGVTVHAPQTAGYLFQPGGIFSPDGHTRAFDARGQGTVSSSGVGVVVLKRLDDALRDADTILAVLRGSAVTNDGADKAGFTAPSVDGQARAIRAAHAVAQVSPDSISYVEAHGSGTALGDPIELAALNEVFGRAGGKGSRAIGSVKTNIGHTHAAAGVAGLIKTVLALHHRKIPPNLHFERPNPAIDFADSSFHVPVELRDWSSGTGPRRAGVSSFGTGGTNAHVVVEQGPAPEVAEPSRQWQLLPLSAKTADGLDTATERLAGHLEAEGDLSLADVAHTLQAGRKPFEHRRFVIARTVPEAVTALRAELAVPTRSKKWMGRTRPVAFVFPGLGDRYQGVARELREAEPVFRHELDRGADILKAAMGIDVREVLFPEVTDPGGAGNGGLDLRSMMRRAADVPATSGDQTSRTWYSQPAVFLLEYALARLWLSRGVRPQAMAGHSIGEYVAACLAGVLSLEDALYVVAERARLIEERVPPGGMVAVSRPERELRQLLGPDVFLAARNGPSLCVLAGPRAAIDRIEETLTRQRIAWRRLQTAHAFHSSMLEPVFEPLVQVMKSVRLRPPHIPYVSNVTGRWITKDDATAPDYWARHMCQTVRFEDGLRALWQAPVRVVLEVGPASALPSLALQAVPPGSDQDPVALASLPSPHDPPQEVPFLLRTTGRLWLEGVPLEWAGLHHGDRRRRVPLPTYPFARSRHWLDPVGPPGGDAVAQTPRKPRLREWFYVPGWTSSPALPGRPAGKRIGEGLRHWLVLADDCGVGRGVAELLEQRGDRVTIVTAGSRMDPANPRHYDELLQRLADRGVTPDGVAHFWSVTDDREGGRDIAAVEADLRCGFYSLVHLTQAISRRRWTKPLRLAVVSTGAHAVTGDEHVRPGKATLLGPCQVLPQEQPEVSCQAIDVVLPEQGSPAAEHLIAMLAAELVTHTADDPVVCYRGRRRWRRTFEPVPLDPAAERPNRLRAEGTYLITGGLGGMGLSFAWYLARTVRANLVLLGRSAFPAREQWGAWLSSHSGDAISAKIEKLQEIERTGSRVLVLSADCTDAAGMERALRAAGQHFGPIHGVIHAAGSPAAGLLQLKDPAVAAGVLAPKVQGLLVLEKLFENTALDFLVLCSSTIALTGGPGQADYCAANAFLDAFAQSRDGADQRLTVSINWDAWQEVGMTHDIVTGAGPDHPLLERCVSATPSLSVYETELAAQNWLVNEHRTLGRATVPGTAHLEMIRAVWQAETGSPAVEIDELVFLSPITVPDGEARRVRVVLRRSGDEATASVISRQWTDDGRWTWHENSRGRVRTRSAEPGRRDLGAIIQRLGPPLTGLVHHGPMTFGPRSQCLDSVYRGDGEALARIALPEEFRGDLAGLTLHPFLLDVATGFASLYLEEHYYMPLSYESVVVHAALPATFYSHLRYRSAAEQDGPREAAEFDIDLIDDDGHELVQITGLVMKRARGLADKLAALDRGAAADVVVADTDGTGAARTGADVFRAHLEAGLRPAEGSEALARVLHAGLGPQVVVATRDINAVIRAMRTADDRVAEERDRAPRPLHPRPNILTPYLAPRNTVEEQLADLWQELLGVRRVGVHDNFFELGGHSLLGVQLAARLRDRFHVRLSLQALFSALTVADMAQVIARGDEGVAK